VSLRTLWGGVGGIAFSSIHMVQAVSCIYPSITLLSSDNHFAKRERISLWNGLIYAAIP
jgi:hypothetical protein